MNKLWRTDRYAPELLHRSVHRSGLQLRFSRRVHPFVRREITTYCRWLRAHYQFPVQVKVTVPNALKLLSRDGDLCWGLCLLPDDPDDSVCICVAGGFRQSLSEEERCSFLYATLGTLTHELGHYFQYINRISLTERGIEWQATYYAHQVLDAYYEDGWDRIADGWPENPQK